MGNYEIKSLKRGLSILTAFQSNQMEFNLSEIAEITGVTLSSGLRIAHTLSEEGYLIRNPLTKGYRLGPMSVNLSKCYQGMSLPDLLDPFLAEFRDQTNETIKLAFLDGSKIVIIARHLSKDYPPSKTYVGNRLPVYCTSLGIAILSLMNDNEINGILNNAELVKLTPKTSIDRESIFKSIHRAKQDGYAINDQQTTLHHRSIAAVITNCSGQPIGSVNISVSIDRMSVKELEDQYGDVLKKFTAFAGSLIPVGFVNG